MKRNESDTPEGEVDQHTLVSTIRWKFCKSKTVWCQVSIGDLINLPQMGKHHESVKSQIQNRTVFIKYV